MGAQLTQFKNQMDQDLQFYQESLQNLKHAQSKFQESKEALHKCDKENKDAEILVPLTGSMYVPGQLTDPEKVIVDIGTGYYVEKDVKYVTEQMEKVQSIGNEKNKVREVVMDVMETKLQQQLAQNMPAKPK